MYQSTILEFLNIGGGEMMMIGIAVLMLFGGKKLPELARGLGKGIREFKDASEGVKREIHRNINSIDVDMEDSVEEAKKEGKNTELQNHPVAVEAPIQTTSLIEEDHIKKVEDKSNELHA